MAIPWWEVVEQVRDVLLLRPIGSALWRFVRFGRDYDLDGAWDYEARPVNSARAGWAGICRIRQIQTGSGPQWQIRGERLYALNRATRKRTTLPAPIHWEAKSVLWDRADGLAFDYTIDLPVQSLRGIAIGRVADREKTGRPTRVTATLVHIPTMERSDLVMTRHIPPHD
jgi:hypothetical protein